MSAAIQRAFTDDGMFLALKVDSADAAEIAARVAIRMMGGERGAHG